MERHVWSLGPQWSLESHLIQSYVYGIFLCHPWWMNSSTLWDTVFQDSSISEAMLADFLNSLPGPGELLLTERYFMSKFQAYACWNLLLFLTTTFAKGNTWKVNNCSELCSRWASGISLRLFFSIVLLVYVPVHIKQFISHLTSPIYKTCHPSGSPQPYGNKKLEVVYGLPLDERLCNSHTI